MVILTLDSYISVPGFSHPVAELFSDSQRLEAVLPTRQPTLIGLIPRTTLDLSPRDSYLLPFIAKIYKTLSDFTGAKAQLTIYLHIRSNKKPFEFKNNSATRATHTSSQLRAQMKRKKILPVDLVEPPSSSPANEI
jgi:hypothetical protein